MDPADARGGGPTCGATVDANCECSAGKVKVYDEDADAFHCYVEPPPAGCPKWDQTFDFDPNVWACVTRPLDDDPVHAAERLKNCMGPGVVADNWNRIEDLLVYDTKLPRDVLGQAKCDMVEDEEGTAVPVPSSVRINPDEIKRLAKDRESLPGSGSRTC